MDLPHTINDDLMRFFDKCRRLLETVENNKDATMEVELFKNGPEMKRAQEKLADRLQLPYSNVTAGECVLTSNVTLTSLELK